MTEITDIEKTQEAAKEQDTALTNDNQDIQSTVLSEKADTIYEEQDELYDTEDDIEPSAPDNTNDYEEALDLSEDINTLKATFPELSGTENIDSLENPKRYTELRNIGLTAVEAYLATTPSKRTRDNRSHLGGNVPIRAHTPGTPMPAKDLRLARELFGGVSDAEILRLYNKVTGNS